jgi:hypothetical protein
MVDSWPRNPRQEVDTSLLSKFDLRRKVAEADGPSVSTHQSKPILELIF